MVFSSPRASAGLSRLDISSPPCWLPAPIRVCASSINRMTGTGENDLRHQPLEAFFKLTFHRRTGLQCAQVKGHDIGVFSLSGTWPAMMRSASPSISALLPTPASPTTTGLFYGGGRECRSSGRFHSRGTVPGQACRYGRLRSCFGVAGKQGVAGFRCAGRLPASQIHGFGGFFCPCCEILL